MLNLIYQNPNSVAIVAGARTSYMMVPAPILRVTTLINFCNSPPPGTIYIFILFWVGAELALTCTIGEVESCARASNMLTLVLRCCPEPMPPT